MQGDDSILKSVYCNYRGRVTVYDVHGQKVHELSGMLDYDKYLEIERRTDPDITQFEGLEDYRCIACELKKKKADMETESEIESEQSPKIQPLAGRISMPFPNIGANSVPRILTHGTKNTPKSPLPTSTPTPTQLVKAWDGDDLLNTNDKENTTETTPVTTTNTNKDKKIENRWLNRIKRILSRERIK